MSTPGPQDFDPYPSLPQPPPRPHHWKLKNLRAALNAIAERSGFDDATAYLERGESQSWSNAELAMYSLAVCLAGNVWIISKYVGVPPKLRPPRHLKFLQMHSGVPCTACRFTRSDGVRVVYFRGTTTTRESWTDVSTLWSPLITLDESGPLSRNRSHPHFNRKILLATVVLRLHQILLPIVVP